MNLATNPWSFVPADVVVASPVASPNGFIQQPGQFGFVNLTTGAAHGFAVNSYVTVIGTTNGRFLGFYKVITVPTTVTALLQNLSSPTSGQPFNSALAPDGGGTIAQCQYTQNYRGEDISWQNAGAAGSQLDIRDRNGLPVWQATATGAGAQNRGKIFWVAGLTLITLQSGVVLVTVN